MNNFTTEAVSLISEDPADTFFNHESAVRSYCRKFPAIFATARNSILTDINGTSYIDFLSGAGSLNYGHNNPMIKEALLEYLRSDGITHSLDLHTSAKKTFIEEFNRVILGPRALNYRLQFTGPTGTNAVEAAMKLARKVTGRTNIVAFSNAFHGMSLGALAASARSAKRAAAGVSLPDITRMPYEGFLGPQVDTLSVLEHMLTMPGSGIDLPAAFIVEPVQAEGGVNVASPQWLRGLAQLASRHGILLIVDDIQAGCGRTGTFFSFEKAGIQPDLVCLAKSISGYGLPMSLVLIKPELDLWQPGEHNGTFRGNNLAFIAATQALRYWQDCDFMDALGQRSKRIADTLAHWQESWPQLIKAVRGLGMIWGIELPDALTTQRVSAQAYAGGLIVETCGAQDNIIKLLPPLTIDPQSLDKGLAQLGRALSSAAKK
ncbi:diaminobutyrate--2-oxoglutarate transaminase [Pseudomonas chlororaphis]|uniref:diaminobutyrate--2-oxoglutarate transaminase n=1 Tax=Pseudomonas chlororaphis TaxID=587753 RepID=UPI0037C98EB9